MIEISIKNSTDTVQAAKNALEKFTLQAMECIGSLVKRYASIVQSGEPGGCVIPSEYAAVTISPESPKVIDGGRKNEYKARGRKKEQRKRAIFTVLNIERWET